MSVKTYLHRYITAAQHKIYTCQTHILLITVCICLQALAVSSRHVTQHDYALRRGSDPDRQYKTWQTSVTQAFSCRKPALRDGLSSPWVHLEGGDTRASTATVVLGSCSPRPVLSQACHSLCSSVSVASAEVAVTQRSVVEPWLAARATTTRSYPNQLYNLHHIFITQPIQLLAF